ncbi:hypothetical protein [Caulobacter sp. NIBR1757]|uniref:hypothetical protein n=1 Tax=Caulobacter sp. NIBR1757 TaxID=3016000 RepID=UPI0022F0B205|nr:hypothetical protein [Caulobacter sp. NIBR1757]WGM37815.1 hypothetical protein AMEJIAPC_00715 [Caulobacter sp. NIBR1757]
MKFSCDCNFVVRDQRNRLPYKATYLSDKAGERVGDWLLSELDSYVAAVRSGAIREWLEQRGLGDEFWLGQTDGVRINDLILSKAEAQSRTAYECEACGRLWLEDEHQRQFSYRPANDEPNNPFDWD